MRKFEMSTQIDCDLNYLFDFHMDSKNIAAITPDDIKVEFLTKDLKVKEGKEVKLKTTKFFIPTVWNVEISLVKKPYMIVDTGITSPFKFWRHSHKFSKKGDFCELKDEIEYELPLGFLGDLFNPLIKKELEKMFQFRQEKTKMILEKRKD